MGSVSDIFGNLKEYLKKDDSLKYNLSGSASSSTEESQVEDLCEEAINVKRAQKRTFDEVSIESFDLTNVAEDDGLFKSGKSRRKIADEIPVSITEEINLCDIDSSPNIQELSAKGRGKKGAKLQKKPRKISYKKALQMINTPALRSETAAETSSLLSSVSTSSAEQYDERCLSVDLTGDVTMSSIHNHAPIFQKKEQKKKIKRSKNMEWDDDSDLDSIDINIKINKHIKKFRHKSNLRFYELFRIIADEEDAPIDNIFCFDGERRIYPHETPDIIGHKISTIYSCRVMKSNSNTNSTEGKIEIKFQSDKWKNPITLTVSCMETFFTHLTALSKYVNFKPDQISLEVDGEPISKSQTPLDLEFEGGEIVDCRITA